MKKAIVFLLFVFAVAACTSVAADIHEPMPQASVRSTPLHFGMYVTPDPDQNPIDPPERFTGFHAGTDYEVSAGELDEEVPVFAVCTGTGLYGGFASGYGGLFVEECEFDGESVIVLYGHLDPENLPRVGTKVDAGTQIGILAPANSHGSDGNRKHLHLGIRKGAQLDVRGYVQTERELKMYIDPQEVLPSMIIDSMLKPIPPYWKTMSREDEGT